MEIFITRNNEKFGPYTVEQIQTHLNSGYLHANDMAWYEGQAGWVPLSQLPIIANSNVRMSAPPPPSPNPVAAPPKKKPSVALYGCGGCLGIVVLMAIVGAIGGSSVKNQVDSASPPITAPVSGNNDSTSSSSVKEAPSTSTAEQDSTPSNVQTIDIKGLGKREAGIVDQVAYFIHNIEKSDSLGPDFSRTKADGIFAVVHVGALNQDKETHSITTSLMQLVDDKGRSFKTNSAGTTALSFSGDKSVEMFMAEVQPDTQKNFSLVYDVPKDAKGFKLKIPSGMFSGDSELLIKAP